MTDLKIGSKVEHIVPPLALYLIEYETGKLATTVEDHVEAMYDIQDLIENPAIIVEFLEEDYIFKCGRCSEDHHHDCVLYYPHNDKKYYSNTNTLIDWDVDLAP